MLSLLVLACAAAIGSCEPNVPTTPLVSTGGLSIVPTLSPAAAVGIADVQTLEVVVRDGSGRVLAEESFPVLGTTVDIQLDIDFTPPCETITLEIRLLNSTGDVVFEADPSQVELCEGAAPPVAQPPLQYVGVGADAQSVSISPPSASVFVGETFTFSGVAIGPGNTAIPGTPIRWSSLDPTFASVPDEAAGFVTADAPGTARIRATLLTGQIATATLDIRHRPTLERSPAALSFQAAVNMPVPAAKTLSIRNPGLGTLAWTVTETIPWLTVSPANGTSTGETDAVSVQVNAAGLAPGTYQGTITISGLPGTIDSPQTTTVSLTVTNELRQVSGRITDATNAAPLAGATVQLRAGFNAPAQAPVVGSAQTDANGNYVIGGLAPGEYTITAALAGFVSQVFNLLIVSGQDVTANIALPPALGPGQTRIILTWGAAPSDLDSHLFGPDGVGGVFHVFYANDQHPPFVGQPDAILDLDDTDGFGPETTTINIQRPGRYCFAVFNFNYAIDAPLSTGASVQVQQGNQIVAAFNVPNQPGNTWTVFALDGMGITPINQLTMQPQPMAPPAPCGGAGLGLDPGSGPVDATGSAPPSALPPKR